MQTLSVSLKSTIIFAFLLIVSACGAPQSNTSVPTSPELQNANQKTAVALDALEREFAALVPANSRVEIRSVVGTSQAQPRGPIGFTPMTVRLGSAVHSGLVIAQLDMSHDAPVYRLIAGSRV